jgi:hypothetical protein
MSIEQLLRESFAARVEEQPALRAPAERAIQAAQRGRRRRTLFGVLGSVAAVLVSGAAVAAVPASSPHPSPAPTVTASPVPPSPGPFSVAGVVDRALRLPDGTTVDLRATDPYRVLRTRDGWLALELVNQLDRGGLWLVTPDRKLHPLVTGAQGPVAVGVDGRHFAWRIGNQLKTAHLTGTRVQVDQTTTAPAQVVPVAVSDTAVVLGQRSSAGLAGFDLWLPARGAYVPSWDATADVLVFGPAPDGHGFLGLTNAASTDPGTRCLALLDPANHLHAARTACGLNPAAEQLPVLSPDRRWLVVPTFDRYRNIQLGLVDLTTVFDHPGYTAVWDASYALGWIGPDTVLATLADNTRRVFQLGRSGSVPFTVVGVPPDAHFEPVTILVS